MLDNHHNHPRSCIEAVLADFADGKAQDCGNSIADTLNLLPVWRQRHRDWISNPRYMFTSTYCGCSYVGRDLCITCVCVCMCVNVCMYVSPVLQSICWSWCSLQAIVSIKEVLGSNPRVVKHGLDIELQSTGSANVCMYVSLCTFVGTSTCPCPCSVQ